MRGGRGAGKAIPGIDRRSMASLSLGHLASDLAQGAPPALLVYLKPKLGLSYTETAAVILSATLSSSLAQPAFGLLSDRRGARWLLASGVALGGLGGLRCGHRAGRYTTASGSAPEALASSAASS